MELYQLPSRSGTRGPGPARCFRRFLSFFPGGFQSQKYFEWERGYKLAAHVEWNKVLNRGRFAEMLKLGKQTEIAAAALRIESKTNLLFSFEKMALRDAVNTKTGARIFADGLFNLLYGSGSPAARFDAWCEAIDSLPRKQSRVLTHPVVTVFPYFAQPGKHIFLKPTVTKRAAAEYGFDFEYESRPSSRVYGQLLRFARQIRIDLAEMKPRDMIDIQSFMWVVASDEYRSMRP